jgi:hypothetical protein
VIVDQAPRHRLGSLRRLYVALGRRDDRPLHGYHRGGDLAARE